MSVNEFACFPRQDQLQHHNNETHTRNKYNTLTPAEAKKLNKFLANNGKPPIRTASVMNKPRPPPIIVTDLDSTDAALLDGRTLPRSSHRPTANTANTPRLPTTNSSSAYANRRHSVNYGHRSHTLNGRMYVTPNASCSKPPANANDQQFQSSVSPNNSISNLSYKSSVEVINPHSYGSARLQTLSVDLGNPAQLSRLYDNLRCQNNNTRASSRTTIDDNYQHHHQHNKLSDESFASAKSEISLDFADETPTKQRLGSKISLASSATFKALQNPYANFKRLFRNIPRPFSNAEEFKLKDAPEEDKNIAHSLGHSISRLCLDRSISPPVCPPPPGELKSMSYMESSVNYSNYDEFTRSRNEKLNKWDPRIALGQRHDSNLNHQIGTTLTTNHDVYSVAASQNQDYDDQNSWQLTSLPVSFERNLTTVLEEKRTSINELPKAAFGCRGQDEVDCNSTSKRESDNYLIKPPVSFGNGTNNQPQQHQQQQNQVNIAYTPPKTPATNTSSSQSLASSTNTADSVLDYHRQTATKYRFSFAQPVPASVDEHQVTHSKDIGLPPRMPLTSSSETKQPDTSSGNSSSNSSQFNGSNNYERRVANFEHNSIDKMSLSDDSIGYGNVNGISNMDADTTLISETSTIQEDSSAMMYANKCAELERTVVSLKNKLINKEKELTDLQLAQLHNDYTIDRLKTQVNRLEKENALLRLKNNQTTSTSSYQMSRINL